MTHSAAESGFHTLAGPELDRFLQRSRADPSIPADVDLAAQLKQILERARALVPSDSGSILLDDPLTKTADRAQNDLWFVTAFGPAAAPLPGTRLPAGSGVAAMVYRTGRSHLAADARADAAFFEGIDRSLGHRTHSLLAAPIALGSTVCGVIELVDREGGAPFTPQDLAVLEIFAGYTSSTLQHALDARRAAELARRDDLTGLANDRWLHQRLVEMIDESDRTGAPCTLVFFDLDHFKEVNDTHGHLAGSHVLREIGFLLRRLLPEPETVLARYGGDEFVIGLRSTARDAAERMAHEVREAIESHTFLARDYGPALPALHLTGAISASLGLAEYRPAPADEPSHARAQALLRRADQAMYAAKAGGKNRVTVASDA